MQDQKAGILNAIERIATPKMASVITKHVIDDGVNEVTLDSLMKLEGVSQSAADRVVAALELHKTLAIVTVRKQREKKPTVADRYKADTPVEERNVMASKVAALRINEEGSKPIAWRKIRETLGLKNEEFHKVIRVSDAWKQVVIARIIHLKAQEGGWEYNGKLEVLTGIEGFSEADLEIAVEAEEHTVVQALPAA